MLKNVYIQQNVNIINYKYVCVNNFCYFSFHRTNDVSSEEDATVEELLEATSDLHSAGNIVSEHPSLDGLGDDLLRQIFLSLPLIDRMRLEEGMKASNVIPCTLRIVIWSA